MPSSGQAAATFQFVYLDAANFGFNDNTPVSPVGGNNGTTLGQQRRNVLEAAAARWGELIESDVPIVVQAQFASQPCSAFGGVLASAGPALFVDNFQNAPLTDTWYPIGLANSLAGVDLRTTHDVNVTVNINIDNDPNCLGGIGYYYGLDQEAGNQIDLFSVLLHELGHGLGFASFVDETDGSLFFNQIDVFSLLIRDTEVGLNWGDMTDGQRAASAINDPNLVWTGAYTNAAYRALLRSSVQLTVLSPANIAGNYATSNAEFGPALPTGGLTGEVVLVNDGVAPVTDGCQAPFVNASELRGKIALIDRGSCNFTNKVFNAQEAGAIAAIIVNNTGTTELITMSGSNDAIEIPSIFIGQNDGNSIRTQLPGVTVQLTYPNPRDGTDSGFVRLHGPNPVEPGSSVSHFSSSTFPDLLMEPTISDTLRSDLDLTQTFMKDIGWVTTPILFPHVSYEVYALESFSPGFGLAGVNDDPDFDLATNWEEYVGGTDALDATSFPQRLTQLDFLSSDTLDFTYQFRALTTDIVLRVGSSTDLQGFQPLLPGIDYLSIDQAAQNGIDSVSSEIPVTGSRSFLRLQATPDTSP